MQEFEFDLRKPLNPLPCALLLVNLKSVNEILIDFFLNFLQTWSTYTYSLAKSHNIRFNKHKTKVVFLNKRDTACRPTTLQRRSCYYIHCTLEYFKYGSIQCGYR